MTPAEQARIDEAVARVVADAPPVSAEALEMLRRDRCPIGQHKSERTGEAA